MHRIKSILNIGLLLVSFVSCIKPFDPNIDSGEQNKYVVNGCVTDEEGYQYVYISLSSPVENPEKIPVTGCSVRIIDDRGNEFMMQESEPGKYMVWMAGTSLIAGVSYKVSVNLPSGEVLESGFDKMPESPPLDSIYYIREDHPTSDPAIFDRGLQFYVNINADEYTNSRFFRWDIVETWEYHAAHAKEYFYDGDFHTINPPDSSTYFCWSTASVKDIFTLSTKNLSQNIYQGYPLQFVNGETSKLSVLYSAFIKQYAISEAAYDYWDKLRVNSNEQGGLYEKQPLDINGNLKYVTGSDKEALGFFYVASARSRRLWINDIEGLVVDYTNYCNEYSLGHFGWAEFTEKDYPVWFYLPVNVGLRILTRECVECEMMGGTTQKPEFWPE